MKKFFLFLSFIIVIPLLAQDFKNEIENQFSDFSNLMTEKKFDKALSDYANSDFLQIVPKEQLVAVMNQMFNSSEIEIELQKPTDIVIHNQVVEEKENKFIRIDYQQKIKMKFKDKEMSSESLLMTLRNEFGRNNVTFEEKTGYFLIDTQKVVIANSQNEKNWKFTILERKQIPILKEFIPEQFLKNFK